MRATIGGVTGLATLAQIVSDSLGGETKVMLLTTDSFSRIEKIFVDRDNVSIAEARAQLANFRVVLRCGYEVAQSATQQAALLTALNVATRCFPGAVRVQGVGEWQVLCPWRKGGSLHRAIHDIGGESCFGHLDPSWDSAKTIAFGTVPNARSGTQVTFDGWIAAVSPIEERLRLPERPGCILAGIAAGALAISELFLGNFGFAIEAGSRVTGVSLWRPDLPWDAIESAGLDAPISFLPRELWLLGLGHLGQAFAWTLSMLPFSDAPAVEFVLQDHDRLVQANLDTGLLAFEQDLRRLKTRIASDFLEARGFRTRLVERRFDEQMKVHDSEPRTLISGMDRSGPRHLLDQAGFDLVIDCGVGGRMSNFDSITLNALPNQFATAAQLWPPDDETDRARQAKEVENLAASRDVYRSIQRSQGCGHVELAGRSVGVPFVGAVASTFAIAELLRRQSGAAQFDRVQVQLSAPHQISTRAGNRRPYRTSFQPASS